MFGSAGTAATVIVVASTTVCVHIADSELPPVEMYCMATRATLSNPTPSMVMATPTLMTSSPSALVTRLIFGSTGTGSSAASTFTFFV